MSRFWYIYICICFPIAKWLTRYIDEHWCWIFVATIMEKKWNFYFIVTKWLSTRTIINTLNNSHVSKRIQILVEIEIIRHLLHICESVCNPWCDTYNSARCRTYKREKANACIIVIARWLYESFSHSFSLALSFPLCTITICKVIMSNWHEIKKNERGETISIHRII
jgi:hypothetical protein